MAKLPTVVSNLAPDLRAFVNRVREALDSGGNNRLITVNDLISSGIAVPGPGGTIIPPGGGVITTPPTPKNVAAEGAIQNIIVTWDDPLYFGHAYAEVWGSDTDNLGEAVQIGMAPGAIFIDAIGPSSIRYYWVRFVNTLGTAGAFNAVAGVRGETGADVEYLLETLTGAITETQLFDELGSRIDLVDQTNGGLINKYVVKIDTNGYVSGFGLASTTNNATPLSDFIIRADRFSIASPSGPGIAPVVPFIVTTTSQVINGLTVPPGTYIKDGFIQNGTITNAKIGNAAIDDAKIVSLSAGKITAGSISVGSFIQSSNYLIGSQGWKIFGDGTAEFAAAAIRGQLTAAQINSNGLSIRDTAGNIILNAGTGNFTGTLNGTATSTVVSNASTALSTANTANSTANTAISELGTKLDNDARNVLSGTGGIALGSLNWDINGNRTSGSGVGITRAGLVAFNASGAATFSLSASTGAANFAGDIVAGTVGGSTVGTTFVKSANYVAGSAGWEIDSNGDAEFNQLTVRSGQVTGALLRAVKINSFSGIYVEISGSTPISTTNGPFTLGNFISNQATPPQYLVGTFTMPAPETAAHRIAAVINVQSSGGSQNKDLAVLLVANASFSGNSVFGEQVAYNTNSGVFGLATNGAGVTTNTYSTQTTFAVFVGGFNAAYTIQTIDGFLFGVR